MNVPRRKFGPALLILAVASLLTAPACQRGGGGGDGGVQVPTCATMPDNMLGTWMIRDFATTLSCPAGSSFDTSTSSSSFGPVTVTPDAGVPGFQIAAPGLTATLSESCEVNFTWQDRDVAQFECSGTVSPRPTTVGQIAPAICTSVTRLNPDGSPAATCTLAAPFSAFVSVR